ncbi:MULTISPECIES: hypothetical protein [Deefgea]|uniref:HEPN AbiU2-like domain-containing protein n=1 Tax=Deefgea chitinilytica TaxID=570276 RepID=A0ABS2CBZ0_9NEIS|nr:MULTISPECIES: hypothetical protein [Deefgea]MBM5571663.1 hypothetical protein [Deefgea chitinilytica]MBM9888898.1 hypothetical protein [Deefgea sp. CFH1-16]
MSKLAEIKLICCHFTKNLAYFRASDKQKFLRYDFLRLANGNFAEIAILEFCKLSGGKNEKYRWQKIVTNQEDFKKKIEEETNLNLIQFEAYIKTIKDYRDKYLSHFDEDTNIKLPNLETAEKFVCLYYNYTIREHGVGLYPKDISKFYKESFEEAVHLLNNHFSQSR